MKRDPQHWVLARNVQAAREWAAQRANGIGAGASLPELIADHEFRLYERPAQPTLPGPLPDDFAVWVPVPPPPQRPVGGARAGDLRKLRVVTA
jgi:anaerobic magnesium-protoporphyrin IX monomethyl ester cyclase